MPRQRTAGSSAIEIPERASRVRQRLRLIDACISALHIYGPSRTTVEKVVALADLSPGIVRFYFDSKDAMLVASLAHLASEFEEKVLQPVAGLKETPVRALERLVELYLDPEIASPRKVSVWYSFWGEASSRQEYHEICGRKDDDFAALVRELIDRLILQGGETHLDADAVALGLIGVLEVLWQGIAFTNESEIDRRAAQQRSLAYLRSVFPRQFGSPSVRSSAGGVPAWAYNDAALLTLERDRLFRTSWQLAGHEKDLPQSGDFLTVELAGEQALVVRDEGQRIRAYRNICRQRPHTLVTERKGHLRAIRCKVHGLEYGLDGRSVGAGSTSELTPLEVATPAGFVLLRAFGAASAPPSQEWASLPGVSPHRREEIEAAADWKVLVEQWLESLTATGGSVGKGARRFFSAPNQVVDLTESGISILQVIPLTAGRTRVRLMTYEIRATGAQRNIGKRSAARAVKPNAVPDWLRQDVELAESTQRALVSGAAETQDDSSASEPLGQFRRSIAALVPLSG